MGTVAALGVPISGLVAVRLGRENHLLEILIRLAIFGVILVGVGEIIGANFGVLVSRYPAWFFGAVAVMFFLTPVAFQVLVGKKDRSHEG